MRHQWLRDIFDLIFINIFMTYVELTMLVHVFEMKPAARAPFEAYLHHISVPAKIVKAESVTEMKQSFTGRDAKAIIAKEGGKPEQAGKWC